MKQILHEDLQRFNYLSAEIDAAYHEFSVRRGISDSSMMILYALCSQGGACLLADIARLSGIRKQTIHSSVKKLEQEGLIRMENCGHRKKMVVLTEKGASFSKKTALPMIQMENEIFASWTEEERTQYLFLTQRYLSELKEWMALHADKTIDF